MRPPHSLKSQIKYLFAIGLVMAGLTSWFLLGAPSNSVTATPAVATLPDAPRNLAAFGGNGQNGLGWNAPSSNGGATITSYRVFRGTTSSNRQIVTTGGCANLGAVLGCTDTNVTNGQSYNYIVSAVNSVGQGPPSNAVTATPVAPTPSAPSGLLVTSSSPTTATLTWADNSNNETGFKVERKTGTGGTYAQVGTQSQNLNFFNDSGLTGGTQYCYRVRATNGSLDSTYSNEKCVTTQAAATAPSAPQNFAASGGNGVVGLAWNAPSSNGGATITNYRVFRGTTSSNRQLVTSGGCANLGAVLGCTDTNVTNGQSYNYIVSAVNSAGQGPPSSSAIATPVSPTPTATTQAASNITQTSFRMNGTINPNGVSTQGFFEWGTSATLSSFTATSTVNIGSGTSALSLTSTLNGGNCGTTYFYRVVATPTDGSLVRGSIVAVMTTACSTPTLSVTTTSLAGGTVGVGYGEGLAASGGQTPYTWSVSSGLPPGLAVNATVGSIFGTPTTAGTFNFTVTVRDSSSPQQTASKVLVITVNPASTSLSITTTALNPSTATVGVGYSAQQAVAATGGQMPYSWSASGLPNGMGINSSSGVVSGTPTTAGTFNFTVTVRDSSSPQQTASKVLVITVADATPTPQKRPLIFIPGIAGSQLNEVNGDNIWPGSNQLLRLRNWQDKLSLEPGKQKNIFAPDIIRIDPTDPTKGIYGPLITELNRNGYLEYLVNGNSSRRTEAGCDLSQTDKTLFVFAYDWRKSNKSNSENVQLLKGYIKCIQKIHPGKKVDILAHSMGGLLARGYILDNTGDHGVNSLITVGSPWLGAPKAIDILETGRFATLTGWKKIFQPDVDRVIKKLSEFYPGMHELLPSSDYIQPLTQVGHGGCPFGESAWDFNDDGQITDCYSFPQLFNIINGRYSASSPATAGAIFHNRPGQDDWRGDQSGVQYFHILGKNPIDDTIGKVIPKREAVCFLGSCLTLRELFETMPSAGDGTVPTVSAERISPGLNQNALGVTPCKFESSSGPVDHIGLTRNANVQAYIFSVLQSTQPPSCPAQSSAPGMSGTAASDTSETPSQPAYYIRILGATSVLVEDAFGNNNAPIDEVFIGRVPGVTYEVLSDKAFLVITPSNQTYTLTLQVGTEPMAVELIKGTSVETTQAIRYQDLKLPVGVKAKLQITSQGVGMLHFDSNGDGTFETSVAPTVSVSESSAQDVEPPTVTFSGTAQQTNVVVTITAADIGSGVKNLLYSLDGTIYQPYTGPLTIDPNQAQVIYAFADDNVANRSSLVIFYPSLTSNQIDNAQFFVRQHYLDFLNREPDASGLGFWTNEITSCGSNAQCQEVKRINVSAAFYLSIEFQETGYLAYRAYKAAFGNIPGKPVPITREEMLPDTQQIGQGIVVNVGDWEQRLEQNKRAFFDQLVTRERFTTLYPQTMTPEQFVDALNANVGGALSQAERDSLVSDLNSNVKTRAQVLQAVAEDADLVRAETNKAFVLMQYFGYLRRNPDDAPDTNFGGFQFWLSKLDQFGGNFVKAEMVKAFIFSTEYKQRFGQ